MSIRKTFFELVNERGQTRVAAEISVDKAIVHRCFHVKQGVNDGLLAACVMAYGDSFDFDGTVVEWGRRRLSDRFPSQATTEA